MNIGYKITKSSVIKFLVSPSSFRQRVRYLTLAPLWIKVLAFKDHHWWNNSSSSIGTSEYGNLALASRCMQWTFFIPF